MIFDHGNEEEDIKYESSSSYFQVRVTTTSREWTMYFDDLERYFLQ